MARVAVASTDGISVNEHFGRAREFIIYEVDEKGSYTLLEKRTADPHCAPDGAHPASAAAAVLADVEVVLVAQIGPGAEQELRDKGVLALTVTAPIDKAVAAYGKRGKFLHGGVRRATGGGCHSGGGHGCSGGCR